MSAEENTHGLPFVSRPAEARPVEERVAPGCDVPPPSEEEARAVAAAFAARDRESAQAEAILGLWASTALAQELVKDRMMAPPADEEERRKQKPRLRKDDDPT